MKLGILKAWDKLHHRHYVDACKALKVDYEVIDILSANWIDKVKTSGCDGFLCRPPCDFQERKSIYDEKIYFINKFLDKPIYPSFDEQFIYENKRNMASFLEIMGFPHPKTNVFSRKEDALQYIESCLYPIVFKSNVGASATGVTIVRDKQHAKKIILSVFGRFNSLLTFGKIMFLKSNKLYGLKFPAFGSIQKHYVIIQEYHKIKWEWRIIKIGDSYFGHQKLLTGDFASGSGIDAVGWIDPPKELLLLVKEVCEKGKFLSMSVDIFETVNGEYLINELQTHFGAYDRPQMYIDGVAGRYIFENGLFVFEEGEDFNKFRNNILRVEHFMALLKNEDLAKVKV
ncbi:MAG: hypothetical protein COB07_11665 [Sulfurovum sp.]|nr:MAG: hypothetical protein COB07_11665 [Sulfurovum sp.]